MTFEGWLSNHWCVSLCAMFWKDYPPVSEASREVANLTWRKNPHTRICWQRICLSVCRLKFHFRQNNNLYLHHSQGVWNLPHKFYFYLINLHRSLVEPWLQVLGTMVQIGRKFLLCHYWVVFSWLPLTFELIHNYAKWSFLVLIHYVWLSIIMYDLIAEHKTN